MYSFVTSLKNISYLSGLSISPFARLHFTSGVGTPLTTALKMAFLPFERGKKLVIEDKLKHKDSHARLLVLLIK